MIVLIGLVIIEFVSLAHSHSANTTRYWDCCKPSCSWPSKSSAVSNPVNTCKKDGTTIEPNLSAQSGCTANGTAFMCANQQPWAINDTISYGFASANIVAKTEEEICCACYELTFASVPLIGKKMIVQVTNTGATQPSNYFYIQIPGGGVGFYNGCQAQYTDTPNDVWGQKYGGIFNKAKCASLPKHLMAACEWRFQWFKNADNPSVNFVKVDCPSAITDKTGCSRSEI